jgi:sugar lactone lactonase YvrE
LASGIVLLTAVVALGAAGCGQGDHGSDSVCVVVGTDGGIVKSDDSVLTFALRPGALAEDTEICIRASDEPPDVFGPAYRVRPNLELALPATITYRHELPADPGAVTIGKVDRGEFEAGMGKWIPLERIALDTADQTVKATDDEIALFYALLDEPGNAGTSSGSSEDDNGSAADAAETSEDAGTTGTSDGESTSTPVTASSTEDGEGKGEGESTTETGDTGPEEESSSDEGSSETTGGVMYPPECDDVYRGVYPILDVGILFPEFGSEDLAMSGDSSLVARSGNDLIFVDGGAMSMPLFTDILDTPTLGLRYTVDGDLIAAQNTTGELLRITPAGEVDVFFSGLIEPNGIYPDGDGNVWVTEYGGQAVRRIDPDGSDDTLITQGAATASGANGIIYDDLRQLVFWTKYDDSELWRAPIADDGTPGAAVMVADLQGHSDGLALDICGNIYVVDEGAGVAAQTRIDRVFLDVDGEELEIEEIVAAGQLQASVANAQFGYGDGFELQDALYAVGIPGNVYRIHVQITGHPIAPTN